jgi:hypothetical protein
MSVIYSKDMGYGKDPVIGCVESYKKWFDLNGMDFELQCMDNKWLCSAWFRNKWGGAVGSSSSEIIKAVHSCYVDAKKEMVKPTIWKRDWSPS